MERFSKIISGFQPLTLFTKCSTLDVSQGPECTTGNNYEVDEEKITMGNIKKGVMKCSSIPQKTKKLIRFC